MTLNSDINDYLDPILKTFEADLAVRLQGYLADAYLRGSAQMISWGRTKLEGKPILYEGPPMQQAVNYASKHTATLIKGLNDETREIMRGVIENGIKEKRGIPGLARDIRKQFEDMSRSRAEMIARTETADTLEQAFVDRSKAMGVTGKQWVTHDPCEICEANEAEGVVPIDHVFSSGHERPPAHPNCRCALAPVMMEE